MSFRSRFAAVLRSRWAYLLVSLLLVAPCFWQPRIHGGDLSTHMYNAWLPTAIDSGRLDGSIVAHPWTGVLFESALAHLHRVAGAEAAQRIAVSAAVLIFAWGAFAFVAAVSGRRCWHLMPSIAVLGYGWVYHMGFFDFYLSLGLCFWAAALLWDAKPKRVAVAVPILALACLSYALPVVWMAGILFYVSLARRQSPFGRTCLSAAFVAALIVFHAIAASIFTYWSPADFSLSAQHGGAGWALSTKYYVVLMTLVALWGVLFLSLIHHAGARHVVSSTPFHICFIGAATVVVLPAAMLIPGLYQAISYTAEKMALGVAICVCALVGAAPPRRIERFALVAVACVFFSFVYSDERARNARDDRMEDLVSQAAPSRAPAAAVNPRLSGVTGSGHGQHHH